MKTILKIAQIVVTLALIGLVLIQTQGAGLSSVFGGGESFRTKRGVEKLVLYTTAVFGALFLLLALLGTIL